MKYQFAYLGNILNTPMNEMWVNNQNMEILRKAPLPTACKNCKHLNYCRCGSVINYCVSGDPKSVPECPLYIKPFLIE